MTQAGDEVLDGQGVGGVVGEILAGDPVDRGVEMGAGVFADGDVVPVPAWAFVVVAADGFHREGGALAELGRQHDGGEIGREGLGEVHDADAAGEEVGGEGGEGGHAWSFREGTRGFSMKTLSGSSQ